MDGSLVLASPIIGKSISHFHLGSPDSSWMKKDRKGPGAAIGPQGSLDAAADAPCAAQLLCCAVAKNGEWGEMTLQILKSKIHKARVTATHLDYNGSLGIDPEIYEACGLVPFEKVLVGNLTNGQRFETYLIPAERGTREVSPNGGVARLCQVGDVLVVMAFALVEAGEALLPQVIVLDGDNRIIERPDYREQLR
jgi:aspartate 1-decarboxylase